MRNPASTAILRQTTPAASGTPGGQSSLMPPGGGRTRFAGRRPRGVLRWLRAASLAFAAPLICVQAIEADELISSGLNGDAADGASSRPAISGDGRWVVYDSTATNLVEGDGNGQSDVFLYDRQTGETRKVSSAAGGGDADGPSIGPRVSADGSCVVFASMADNLVDPPIEESFNGLPVELPWRRIFLYDVASGTTRLISKTYSGEPSDFRSDYATVSDDCSAVA